jgi:hypothetical protein
MTNANGSYTSMDSITMTFEGTFAPSTNGDVLSLQLQGIVDGLNTVTGASGQTSAIKNVLESASYQGSF